MAVYRLDNELWFPDPHLGEKNGLVAVGGDLSVERLLLAYSNGFFPWFSFRNKEEPYWYCPQNRYVIFPKEIHISHSMKQLMRQNKYIVTINQYFDGVIRGCSTVDGRYQENGAWLGPEIIQAYTELNRLGFAASVEVWEPLNTSSEKKEVKLVVALIHLAKTLDAIGGLFIDCQFETPHLKSMGGKHISYDKYMEILNKQELC